MNPNLLYFQPQALIPSKYFSHVFLNESVNEGGKEEALPQVPVFLSCPHFFDW